MGNFEKLVVLTVLFLAVIILGVSVHQAGEADGAGDPLGTAGDAGDGVALVEDDAPARPSEGAALSSLMGGEEATEVQERPDFSTLGDQENSSAETDGAKTNGAEALAESAERAAASSPRGLLVHTAGLVEPPFGDDFMLYTWKSGDTLVALAAHYYGDRKYRELLLTSNEGRSFRPGDRISMPVRDLTAGAGERPAFEAAPEQAKPVETPAVDVVTYTVQEGDSLWSIAKAAYGKGTQWEAIFKANRDVMKSDTDLRPGMELRLPQ